MWRFILPAALAVGTPQAQELSVENLLEAIPDGHLPPLFSTLVQVPMQGSQLGSGPFVAEQWSAAVLFDGDMIGIKLEGGRGKFFYDRPGQRYRLNYSAESQLFRPDGKLEQDTLSKNTSMPVNYTWGGLDENGVCNPFPNKYSDYFAWLAIAKKGANQTVEGRPCTLWTALTPTWGKTTQVNLTACVADDGSVVEILQNVAGTGKFSGATRYRFSNVTFGPPDEAAFLPSYPCAQNWPAMPCPQDEVETLDIYRIFGKGEPQVLSNRDTGDVLGDVSFICTQGSGAEYESKFITHWQVEVSKAFGQYALCNFNGTANVCMGAGSQLKRVGRRGSQIQSGKKAIGQCDPNVDVGSQYSFPESGQCPPNVVPSEANGCFWANARPLRTVAANCVMQDRKLLEVCKTEFGHAPFTKSAAIFRDALASADVATGGCPDAPLATIVV